MNPSTPLKIAVLGCGYWGKNLVRNFHKLGALAMVCDPAEEGRASARQIAPDVQVAETFDQALQSREVTAVVIAAPAALHYSLAKAVLLAGKEETDRKDRDQYPAEFYRN